MFNGMADSAWEIIKVALPREEKRSVGMPHSDFRCVLNAVLWITITGARWSDLPKTPAFASKSSAHRWLLRWQRDGTWQKILDKLLRIAAYKKRIDTERLLVDGSFSPCKTRRWGSRIRLQGEGKHDTSGDGWKWTPSGHAINIG